MTPLAWQPPVIEAIVKALSQGKSFIDASDTGTGKTTAALFALKQLGARAAVCCPKSVIPAWEELAAKIGVPLVWCVTDAYLRRHPELLEQLADDVIPIVDEVHRFSAHDSDNAKMLRDLPRPTLMLSATAADSPVKLRAIGHQLGLTTWGNWYRWTFQYGCEKNFWGGLEFNGNPEHLEKLHAQIFHTGRGARVRVKDLGDLFPKNHLETRLVDVEDTKAIDEAYLEELKTLESDAESHLAAMTRARQIVELQKIPAMLELTRDVIESGNSVVLFVSYRDTLDRVVKALKCPQIHGDQGPAERVFQVKLMQENLARVIAVMVQAGGVGLGLQDLDGNFPRVSIHSPGFSAREVIQAVGRTPRADAKSPCRQIFLFARGTIDERIREKVEAKMTNIETLNDGDLAA